MSKERHCEGGTTAAIPKLRSAKDWDTNPWVWVVEFTRTDIPRHEVSLQSRPIIFSTPMVQAILRGIKTQTRRVLKPQPEFKIEQSGFSTFTPNGHISLRGWFDTPSEESGKQWGEQFLKLAYGKPGDLLYVRETWGHEYGGGYLYKASHKHMEEEGGLVDHKWKPSIHMPKKAARIWLQITNIRVEQLQQISQEDAIHEGIEKIGKNCEGATIFRNYANPPDYIATGELSPRLSFRSLWDSINS